jgi:non-heme chloroperoxidase
VLKRKREEAKAYSAALVALSNKQISAFEKGVPAARVVNLPGANHYVYLSNEAEVLREMKMKLFLSDLR